MNDAVVDILFVFYNIWPSICNSHRVQVNVRLFRDQQFSYEYAAPHRILDMTRLHNCECLSMPKTLASLRAVLIGSYSHQGTVYKIFSFD